MNPGPVGARLGFWSSVVVFLGGALLLSCIAASSTLPPALTTEWSGVEPYAEAYRASGGSVTSLSFFAAFTLCPAYALQIVGITCAHRPALGKYGKLGLPSAFAFSALAGLNYVVQLTIVRSYILGGRADEVAWLVFQNPSSPMLELDILGWFFLGMAFLTVSSVFRATAFDRVIRYLLITNAVVGLVEMGALFASYLALAQVLLSATSVLLMCVDVLLIVHFRRLVPTRGLGHSA